MTTTGNNTSVQRKCAKKPTFFSSNDDMHLFTTYYTNTTPLSYITPHSPMASLHVSSDLPTWAFSWNLLLLVCFTIATILLPHSKKKRTSRRVNHTAHTQPEYIEEPTEHATVAKDNEYWNREHSGGPAQYDAEIYNALYSADEDTNDDGFSTDDEDVKEMLSHDDGFLMDEEDVYLHMEGNTQAANHQEQEVQSKMTYKEVEEMFSNDDGFFIDDLDDEEMIATDNGYLTDDSELNMNGTTSTGKSQSTKRHEPVILVKNTLTKAPLLCRPNVNVHPSRKYMKPRPRPEPPRMQKQKRQKHKPRQNYTKWQTNDRNNLPKWTSRHIAAYLSIPEMALEWIVEPG
jgi:hypothetical protein